MRARLSRLDAGVEILGIHLTDVHPPVEVVSAFRDVASAQEEQVMRVNEAEAYSKQQIPIARGTAAARLETAAGYKAGRIFRSEGDASRFKPIDKRPHLTPFPRPWRRRRSKPRLPRRFNLETLPAIWRNAFAK